MNSFYTDINDTDGVEIQQAEVDEDIETIALSPLSEQRQQRDDDTDAFGIVQTISFAFDDQREEAAVLINADSDEDQDHDRSDSSSTTSTVSLASEQSTFSRFKSFKSARPFAPASSSSSSVSTPISKKRKITLTTPCTPPPPPARGIFRRSSVAPVLLSPPLLKQRSRDPFALFEEDNTKHATTGNIDLSDLAFPSLTPHAHTPSQISTPLKPRRTTFNDIPMIAELELMDSLFSSNSSDTDDDGDWSTASPSEQQHSAIPASFHLSKSPAFDYGSDDNDEDEEPQYFVPSSLKRRRTPLSPASPTKQNPFFVPRKVLFPSSLSLRARMQAS